MSGFGAVLSFSIRGSLQNARFPNVGTIDEPQAFKTKADVKSKTTASSDPTRPMRAVIAKKEVVAVSRSICVHLCIGLGALICSAPGVFCVVAAEPASARQCAEADLVLMHRLTDEAQTSVASSSRLVQAAMLRLDARAACRAGDYDRGTALFAEADALTLDAWRMWRVPETDFSSNNVR